MAGGVTPKQIYQALLDAGASTVQAIGIMANMINESGLDPESVNRADPNGGSFGLVQENGSKYAGLVTGNPSGDMINQVKVIALNGGFKAASGQTPAEAAGNFAANYERCQGCQPGGAQYNGRVSNASTVAAWVSSGNWPKSAGSATAGATSSQGSAPGGPECALSLGGQHIGILFGRGPSLPSACLIRKTEVRAFMGALIFVGGGLIVLPGLVIILAYGFRASGAARAVTQTASVVSPYGRAVNRVASAPSQRRQRRAQAVAREQRTQQAEVRRGSREARQAAGGPAQQQRAVRGQAPRRPSPRPRPQTCSSSHRSRRSRPVKMAATRSSCLASLLARSSSFCSMVPLRRADRATITSTGMRMPAISATSRVNQSAVRTVSGYGIIVLGRW